MPNKLGAYILTFDTARRLMKAHRIDGSDRDNSELERTINDHLAERGETRWKAAAVPELDEEKRKATRDARGWHPDRWMVFVVRDERPGDGETPEKFGPLLENDADGDLKKSIIDGTGVGEDELEWVSFWDLYDIGRMGLRPGLRPRKSEVLKSSRPLTLEYILASIEDDGRRIRENPDQYRM